MARNEGRVTFNVSSEAADALEELGQALGDTKTSIINRALCVLALVEDPGSTMYVQEVDDPELAKLLTIQMLYDRIFAEVEYSEAS